jgi:hypothetical protein
MYITTPHRSAAVPATPDAIAEIIRDLPHRADPFAILGLDQQRYMQTLWTPGGFILEFQEGGVEEHYRCARRDFTADDVIRAFEEYLAWGGKWRPNVEAAKVEVRPPYFRLGYALGHFLGRLRRLFSRGA